MNNRPIFGLCIPVMQQGRDTENAWVEMQVPRSMVSGKSLNDVNTPKWVGELTRYLTKAVALPEIPEEDIRVDVYTQAVPTNRERPHTWPKVRITHLPTGITADASAPLQLSAKVRAVEALRERLHEKNLAEQTFAHRQACDEPDCVI